jgi:hypothetical protein
MPLVRSAAPSPAAPAPESREQLSDLLVGSDAGERRRAARSLSLQPDAAALLAARLAVEADPSVREALFAGLVAIGGTPAATLVAPLLGSEDAALRNGAVEALKTLMEAGAAAVDGLLGDPDPDVRLMAIEVTRAWPVALAIPRLLRVIESDPHVNVCGAAVDVATGVGADELNSALAGLRARFADEPFLGFAIDIACSRSRPPTGRDS